MDTQKETLEPLDSQGNVKTRHKRLVKYFRLFIVFSLSVLAGIEAAFIGYFIRNFFEGASIQISASNTNWKILHSSAVLSGLAVLMLVSLIVFVPKVWRKVVGIGPQRIIIYTTIQVFGIAIGLIGLNEAFSFWLTFIIVFAGSRTWWSWERRWRGVGHSPSLRSGIIRPPVHPGQVWFAYVKGEKETKNRPIITLRQSEINGRWIVAYFTTQAPKYYSQSKNYLEVKAKDMRGMGKDSWVNISDIKELKRNQFRTYIGLAPKELYEKICKASDIMPDPSSWTIDESSAGKSYGPIEAEFRRAIGLDRSSTDPSRSVEDLRDVLRGFLRLNIKN